jgi:Dolichyl-phosphate-mannose-protein mannosyltransferase
MKNMFSLVACGIICAVMLQQRVTYSDLQPGNPTLKITEWDAFGYYMYLPSIFIYKDITQLNWVPGIDKKYAMTGGDGVQATKVSNGNYVCKYLSGVAILEAPLFLIGHISARLGGYPTDGFSAPYQYAISFGVLLYCILAIFLLRKILLRYFTDSTVAITLLAVCLATNFIEYAVIENGQSHSFIFPLYVLILYATIKWHEKPTAGYALAIGYIIGLACICRPTEAIMLFIPLLWNTHTKAAATEKWQLFRQHKRHLYLAIFFGFIGILPQLIYWKFASGSFVYDVGSSWDFLSPHFRVLFGWEKGWFIYTPITVFFIAGLFFRKPFPFRKSVLWFCLLNVYLIISWRTWRYGGSYSTRALVQSYPMFALPFAAFVEYVSSKKWRWLFYALSAYLLFVNLFQIRQYRSMIIHYDDMNRLYYSRIYLNPHPTPIDMSLLDNSEVLNDEQHYNKVLITNSDSFSRVIFPAYGQGLLMQTTLPGTGISWLKIESEIQAPNCLWQTYLNAEIQSGDSIKHARVRLFSALSKSEQINKYAFYVAVPELFANGHLKLYLSSPFAFEGTVRKLTVTAFEK